MGRVMLALSQYGSYSSASYYGLGEGPEEERTKGGKRIWADGRNDSTIINSDKARQMQKERPGKYDMTKTPLNVN